jgi:hypothetical protein
MLNPNQTLILLAEHDDKRILVGFHPEPGNYEVYFPPGSELSEGQIWSFFCPVCRKDLKTAEDDNLCAVLMLEPTISRRVLFSRVAGEQATYVLYDSEIEHRHGKNSVAYQHRLVPIRRGSEDNDRLPGGEAEGDGGPTPDGGSGGEKEETTRDAEPATTVPD